MQITYLRLLGLRLSATCCAELRPSISFTPCRLLLSCPPLHRRRRQTQCGVRNQIRDEPNGWESPYQEKNVCISDVKILPNEIKNQTRSGRMKRGAAAEGRRIPGPGRGCNARLEREGTVVVGIGKSGWRRTTGKSNVRVPPGWREAFCSTILDDQDQDKTVCGHP